MPGSPTTEMTSLKRRLRGLSRSDIAESLTDECAEFTCLCSRHLVHLPVHLAALVQTTSPSANRIDEQDQKSQAQSDYYAGDGSCRCRIALNNFSYGSLIPLATRRFHIFRENSVSMPFSYQH
jgi:hypothetical protein